MDKINVLTDGHVKLVNKIGDEDTVLKALGLDTTKMDESIKRWHLKKIIVEDRKFSILGHIVLQFEFKMPIFIMKKYFTHVNNTVKSSTLKNISAAYDLSFYMPSTMQSTKDGEEYKVDTYTYNKIDLYYKKAAKIYDELCNNNINPENLFMLLPQSVFVSMFETGDLLNYYLTYKNFYTTNNIKELSLYASAVDSLLSKHVSLPWNLLKEIND